MSNGLTCSPSTLSPPMPHGSIHRISVHGNITICKKFFLPPKPMDMCKLVQEGTKWCGCVCLGSGVGCAPHSWPGWWAVFVLACALRLHPTTPGWGARYGCVCLGSGFGCAPPLLAGVLGCACLCACSPCTPPLLAGVRSVGVCAWAGVSAAPPHSWLGSWGVRVCVRAPLVPRHSWLGCAPWVCVFGLGFRLHPASPGWGVGLMCAGVGASLAPCHSWLGCAPWVCVFGLGFRLHPASPGWGVGLCVCWCGRPACTPPLLAGVRAVAVCVWAWVSAAPRHSWLGCWAVCVLVWALRLHLATPGRGARRGCVCLGSVSAALRHSWLGCWAVCVLVWALRLHPATPGWGARRGCVCLGSGFSCTPPLLAGVMGCVCAGVGAPLAPRHSWLGCAPWVRVFGLGFRLQPATPCWGVEVCVCWCGRSACTPPLLPGSAPWVCVFGLGFRLRPATPGWGVGLCMCWCARSVCTPPLLAGVRDVGVCVWARISAAPRHSWLGCWGVCVLVCVPPLYPATPGLGVRRGCVRLSSGLSCAPPLLAGVLGCVCAGVRAPPVPRFSWLGCAALPCVFGLWFRLHPATPGWGVGLCVCSCARSACTLPHLAGVGGVGVCVWAPVSAAPRHSWPGCALSVCVLGLGFWLRPATSGWGFSCVGWLLPGTCSCAVVSCVLCALSGFVAPGGRPCLAPVHVHRLWPAACLSGVPPGPAWCAAPRSVLSLSVLRLAFSSPWCLSPSRGLALPVLLGGCAGHAEAGREEGSLCLPLAPAKAGALGSLRVVPVRGPAMGLVLAGPSGVGLGLRALRWLACVDPVTDASGFPDRPSFDGGLGRCTGAVSCGRRHRLLRVGGCHARVLCVCACACSSWPGRAGRPHGRVLVRLTFSFGRFGFLLCLAPSGLRLPSFWSFLFSFPLSSSARPLCLLLSLVSGPGCPGPWRCVLFVLLASRFSALCALSLLLCCLPGCWLLPGRCLPPPPFVSRDFSCCRSVPLVFFSLVRALVVSRFLWFPARGALGLGAVLCVFFPPASRLSVRSRFFFPAWPLASPWCLVPPLPTLPLCLAGFVAAARCPPPLFFLSLRAPPCLWLSLVSGPGCPGPWRCVSFALWASRFSALRALSPFSVSRLAVYCSLVVAAPPPLPLGAPFFFFFCVVRPRCLRLSLVSGPGCLGPRRCALFALLASRFSTVRAFSPLSCLPSGRWLLPGGCCPPPPAAFCVPRFSLLPLGAVCRVLCCAVYPGLRCCAALLRVVLPGVVLLCAVLFCCARLMPLPVVPCPLVLPIALGPCALRRCVLQCSPALCVFCRCVVVCAVVRRSALCCVCPGVLCCAFPVLSALCGAGLRCAGALVLCCSCSACCCWRPVLWCAAVCCAVSFGVLWCGAGSGGPWLSAGTVLWRPAVRFSLLVVLVCVFSLCVRCCVALRVVLFGSG